MRRRNRFFSYYLLIVNEKEQNQNQAERPLHLIHCTGAIYSAPIIMRAQFIAPLPPLLHHHCTTPHRELCIVNCASCIRHSPTIFRLQSRQVATLLHTDAQSVRLLISMHRYFGLVQKFVNLCQCKPSEGVADSVISGSATPIFI